MNKLDVQHSSLIYQPAEEIIPIPVDRELTGRLIVLIPADADYALATRRIWKLATTTGMPVQLISLCKDLAQEPSIRRALVTMSALIRDGRVCAEAKVEIGMSWVQVAKKNYQPGDMIVCFAEQNAGLLHRPLSQILESNMKVPVYVLSGLAPQRPSVSTWLSQILVWVGSLGIIAGSALVQIRITALSQDWAQTTLLILSVIAEAWLIWGWNSLFS